MSRSEQPGVKRFGVFELDTTAGELLRAGRRLPLTGQPLRVLALLVSRAGQIVTRDELQREIWGTDTHVDFDTGLSTCINQIRAALGDRAASPRFIETLPRRGYRFIAPVDRAAMSSSPLGRATVIKTTALAAAILIAVLSVQRLKSPPVLVAVLAVDVESTSPQLEPLSVTLTHALIGSLTTEAGPRARVASAAAAQALGDKSPDEIRRAGTEYVVMVTLRTLGGPVLLHVKLVECATGTVRWASDQALPLEQLQRDQLNIATELSKQLAHQLTRG